MSTASAAQPDPHSAHEDARAGKPAAATGDKPRTAALRQATRELHEQVDAAMMALRPFDDRAGYARFLAVQYRFHQLTARYFSDPELNMWFPGLATRERLAAVEQDCRDLGLDPATYRELPLGSPVCAADRARAVGWLYVNEGSNLGAAFLYKHAQQLGFDGQFGARHLAPHADGRAAHWHAFVAQIEAAPLTPEQEALAVQGARDAFQRVVGFARAG